MRRPAVVTLLTILLAVGAVVSLTLGKYPVALRDTLLFFTAKVTGCRPPAGLDMALLENLFFSIRLPRVVAAILVGSSLSVAGAAFQAMFINPLVSPSLLGVLAGASFGAALGMLLFENWLAVQASTFVFGFISVLVAVGIARMFRGGAVLLLILGGVISGALFTSLLSVVKYCADPYDKLPAIVYWLMGGLSYADAGTVWFAAVPMVISMMLIISMSGYLNVLSMGDEEARSLGIPVERIRLVMIFLASLVSSLTVVIAGMIGWVGLIIPHITRMLVGPDNRVLIPSSILIGAIYLLLVDNLCRLLFETEIPIGIVTSLVGIPFFVFVMRRARRGWGS
ncbi:MAG: iron ABC transporter permease [Syntrophales bacterium]|jgi:iron complex transport system permease protein|nr:iron ABC transporter permease [Syntrophales bacterium]